MAQKKRFFQKYRVVFHSSPLWLKFGLLVTILVAVVSLSVIGAQIAAKNADTESKRHQAAELEQSNKDTQDKLDNTGTVDSVIDIAGDELGMVDKDATIVPIQ